LKKNQIIGLINAGACFAVQLADDDFKQMIGHDSLGDKTAIMSVVVLPCYLRQGIVNIMLKNFIEPTKNL